MAETHSFLRMSSTGRVTPDFSIHLRKTQLLKSRLVPTKYESGILHTTPKTCATRFVRTATPIGYCASQFASTSRRLREAEPWRRLVGVRNPGAREKRDRQIICRVAAAIASDPPSCIFVGPIETAEKARLEALYQQVSSYSCVFFASQNIRCGNCQEARDSYYSGRPLIVDDMFDKVETRLRWHGSKLVLKYPRCSLKRFSAYADAEVDPSQMRSLAVIWSLALTFGVAFSVGIPACTFNKACHDAVHSHLKSHGGTHTSTNGVLAVVLGFVIGVPVVSIAVTQLQGLWRGDLIALKGCCPNCGEEVYTFVRADDSMKPKHRTECHVCERSLVFQANIERFNTRSGQPWAYGRVYLVSDNKKNDENS